ncbi:DUF6907 domain-containing protein [Streptacidiphilus sp. PAMC 29251]
MANRPPSTPMETLGPCPPWCDGIHAEGGEQWGISQFHETLPLKAELVVNDFRYEIAEAVIVQYPRASDPERRKAYISMDLSMGGVEMEPEDIERLAAALEGYLPKLRWLAAQLVEIRANDPGDPTMRD